MLIENQFDLSQFSISVSRKPVAGNRFKYEAKNKKEIVNKTAKFAIKYFTYEKVLIMWQVKGIEKDRVVDRIKFSVDKDDVFRNLSQGFTVKNLEFNNRGEEIVWFFVADEWEKVVIKIKELS